MAKINPFKPNSPVPFGMFAGRINEIKALEKGLHQTKNGHPAFLSVTGERGIGKSSLVSLIRSIAEGAFRGLDYDTFNFVVIDTVISKQTTLASFISLVERDLKRELGRFEKLRKYVDNTWEFVKRLNISGSSIGAVERDENIDLIIDDFSYSLAETCKRICRPEKDEDKRDGIILFVDEADKSSPSLHLGYFIKVLTETLLKRQCQNVMVVLAGLPDVKEKLAQSHESSPRIFSELKIGALGPDDRKSVVDRGLEEANKINAEVTTISPEARNLISTLSEGYPHFIQQFAYSAFEANDDGEISAEDVSRGAFGIGGAIDAIGAQFYEGPYNEQIKSDEYREVLEIMADQMNAWVKKSEIRQEFSGSDQTLTDALKALTARKIILKNPSKMGEYRLQQRGFALWIKLFGQRGS